MATIIEFPKGGKMAHRMRVVRERMEVAKQAVPLEQRLAAAVHRPIMDRTAALDAMATSLGMAIIATRPMATNQNDAGPGGFCWRLLSHFEALVQRLEKL